MRVFDRYAGEQVGEGSVSLALRLSLADPGRTLTDDEIDAAVARVRDALAGRRAAAGVTRVHVFGAAGFAGAQLAELVDRHPALELGVITARGDAGRRLVDVAPEYRVERRLEPPDVEAVDAGDFAAVCYPHAEAAALVSELVDRGARVLDVSADHRLHDATLYPPVYGFEHPRPDLLAEAVYGLPERYRDAHRGRSRGRQPGLLPRGVDPRAAAARGRASPTWSSTPRAASAAPAARPPRPSTTRARPTT